MIPGPGRQRAGAGGFFVFFGTLIRSSKTAALGRSDTSMLERCRRGGSGGVGCIDLADFKPGRRYPLVIQTMICRA